MKINRVICILSIIGFGIFASYYGGNISYALFYLSLFTPLVSFLYTLYVYICFKLHQSIDSHLVIKGDWTHYSFIIANENYITFRNIKVNFLRDKSTIESADLTIQYSLLPSESEHLETRIKCNYRGEYSVGVDSVEVTDFLNLFTITYPIGSKLKAIVLPRIVPIERLGIAPPQVDVKNPFYHSNVSEEELDTEIRKYYPGDHKKRIHWKASAKQQELISRKYLQKPKAEIILFMDMMRVKKEELQAIIAEDKIIESILAIANYYAQRNTSSQIIYEMDGIRQIMISGREEFNAFYKSCISLKFKSEIPVNELMTERLKRGEEGLFFVTATQLLTKEFYLASLKVTAGGNYLCVLFISDDVSEETKEFIDSMRLAGISIFQVLSNDEIGDILTREIK